jgi:phenylalanyl-tRNA synthetase beta chain
LQRLRETGISFEGSAVEVRNPLSEDQRFLRTSLIGGFVAYCTRIDRPVRSFEIGDTFRTNDDGGIDESSEAIFGFAVDPSDEPAWRDSNFLRLKGDCEALLAQLTGRAATTERAQLAGLHPGKTAALLIDGTRVATLGRVDPRLAAALGTRLPVYLAIVALEALPPYAIRRFHPPSKFPGTSRDLALTLDASVDAAAVERTIADAIGDVCTSVTAFDEYRGPQIPDGKKSLAVRIGLQLRDATITDAQAEAAIARARDALSLQFDATLRE